MDNTKDYIRQGCTIIYVSVNNTFAGFLALSDTVRKESENMIAELLKLGICPVLLTGDHENAANTIASLLHIEKTATSGSTVQAYDGYDQTEYDFFNDSEFRSNYFGNSGNLKSCCWRTCA